MKKIIGVLAIVLTVSASSTAVFACGHGHGQQARDGSCGNFHYPAAECYYVDENGDGICDNCQKSTHDCVGRYDCYTGQTGRRGCRRG